MSHLMQSISIRCCSAILFSLLTLRWSAVKMLRLWRRRFPHLRLISSRASFAMPLVFVDALPSLGGIEKYSSSSRRTMIACFERRGF